jgi:hypothetical protein
VLRDPLLRLPLRGLVGISVASGSSHIATNLYELANQGIMPLRELPYEVDLG